MTIMGIIMPSLKNLEISNKERILKNLAMKVAELSITELDKKYGSEDWCFKIEPHVATISSVVEYTLDLNDKYDIKKITKEINATFNKYWDLLVLNLT